MQVLGCPWSKMKSTWNVFRFRRAMFSVIVCSHRPELAKAIQQHYAEIFRNGKHEFILIDDAKSLCEGFERGFHRSSGAFVIFSHDDVEFVAPDIVASRLERHLRTYDMIGIAGTTKLIDGKWWTAGDPYCYSLVCYPAPGSMFSVRCAGRGPACIPDIQGLDGCFIACRREVIEAVGFDAVRFDGFHLYALDLTFRAHLCGFKLGVCRDVALIHVSLGHPGDVWQAYRECFEAKHRGALSPGVPAKLITASFRIPKQELPQFCEWENLSKAIRWS
jgi:hypothetical protein